MDRVSSDTSGRQVTTTPWLTDASDHVATTACQPVSESRMMDAVKFVDSQCGM